MSEKGYDIRAALAAQAVWGTAEALAAGDGAFLYTMEHGNEPNFVPDPSLTGSVVARHDDLGIKRYSPSFSSKARYIGELPLALALLMGDDSGGSPVQVGTSDGYVHKFVPQDDNYTEFATLARTTPGLAVATVREYDSVKIMRVELTITAGDRLMYSVKTAARDVVVTGSVNDSAAVIAATPGTPLESLMFHDMIVYLADEDGAAFAAGDKLTVNSLTLAFERPYKIFQAANSQLIAQPFTNGHFVFEVGFDLPEESEIDLETDMLGETTKRLSVPERRWLNSVNRACEGSAQKHERIQT